MRSKASRGRNTRDLGIRGSGAGKGSFPRPVGPDYYKNWDLIKREPLESTPLKTVTQLRRGHIRVTYR